MASFFMPKVGESWFKKEAEEMQYEWMKRPGESEADYQNRLRRVRKEETEESVKRSEKRRPSRGLKKKPSSIGSAFRCESRAEDANKRQARGPWSQMKNRPGESLLDPVRSNLARIAEENLLNKRARAKAAKDAEAAMSKDKGADAWKPEESVTDAGKAEAPVTDARKHEESVTDAEVFAPWTCPLAGCRVRASQTYDGHLLEHRANDQWQIQRTHREKYIAAMKPSPRCLVEYIASTQQKTKRKGADAGKPDESVAAGSGKSAMDQEAGKPKESVTVGSVTAMYQEMNSPSCTDDEKILQQVLQYKLDGVDLWQGAEEKERRAMVKTIQERMARKEKALLQWQHKLPTKDEESRAQAPVTGADKPEESAIRQEVTVGSVTAMYQEMNSPSCTDDEKILQQVLQDKLDGVGMWQGEGMRAIVKTLQEIASQEVTVDDKETLGQVLQEKLDILDLEDVSNMTTKPTADPNSTTIQDDHVDKGKSALAKKTAEKEAEIYAEYRSRWECDCCKDCDHFLQITMLSSMQYTHYTPGMIPFNMSETLQIFSIKLKLRDENAAGFELPLCVYGAIAVRDTVDCRRNIIFSCGRTKPQQLTHDDPFLHLTGPSRAIVSADRVYFEINLRVKDAAAACEDKPLMVRARSYNQRISTVYFDNLFCTLEVCLQTVKESVQATIVGVQMVHKEDELCPLNFAFGGRVACTPLPRTTADSGGDKEIVLIESKGRVMPQGDSGYVHLWRQVVSVERGGGLDVVIQAYKKSGAVHAEGRTHFTAQSCKISQQQCIVGPVQVTVTVAWSIVPTDMDDVVFNYA